MSVADHWTPADQAELDVLLHELVGRYFDHRERCTVPCPHLQQAIQAVIDWREGRQLRSKASWLRLRELERERQPGRVHIAFDQRGEVVEYELTPSDEQAAA